MPGGQRRCCCCSAPPTATRAATPTRTALQHHRDNISHITFGKGVHYCLGANLARLEGRVALDEILNRWPEWDIDYDTAQLASTSTVRGWEKLRILLP
jgi:cytochrome P450